MCIRDRYIVAYGPDIQTSTFHFVLFSWRGTAIGILHGTCWCSRVLITFLTRGSSLIGICDKMRMVMIDPATSRFKTHVLLTTPCVKVFPYNAEDRWHTSSDGFPINTINNIPGNINTNSRFALQRGGCKRRSMCLWKHFDEIFSTPPFSLCVPP